MRYENASISVPCSPPPPTGHSYVISMNNKYLWCMCLFVFDQITKPSVDHKRQSWPTRQQPFLAFSLNLGPPVQWWSAIIWMIILLEYEDTLNIRVHKCCLVLNIAPKCQKCLKMPKNAQKCLKRPIKNYPHLVTFRSFRPSSALTTTSTTTTKKRTVKTNRLTALKNLALLNERGSNSEYLQKFLNVRR